MINNDTAIIQNTKSFFYNSYLENLTFLDSKIVEELKVVAQFQFKPIVALRLIKLLNTYCYLYDIKLSYVLFKNTNNKEFLSNFLQFCCSDFITKSLKTKQLYRNYLTRMVEKLNENRIVYLDVDIENINYDYKLEQTSIKNKLIVLQGVVFDKKNTIAVSLINCAVKFGELKALDIYNKIFLYPNHPKLNSGTILILNKYIDYSLSLNKDFFNTTTEDLTKYVSVYFLELDERKINIDKYKAFWNNFIEYINDVFNFNLDAVFLKLKTQKIIGHSTNIKIKNNKQIKSKLITDIPLEISDQKSIFILRDKINQDIEVIESWANYVINDYLKQQDISSYPSDDFFTEPMESLKTKYKAWRDGGLTKWIAKNINVNSIFNRTHLMAICSLLVINHPAITEQFLKELTRKSVVKTDNGMFLIGKKHRKGLDYSEQKILLNEKTKSLIEILVVNSEKMGKFINSDSLMLHVHDSAYFKIIEVNGHLDKTKSSDKSMFDFIQSNYDFDEISINEFIKKSSLTKIRATCGVKEFFNSQNTKKMAEILGHENYSPALLSHYLPEPIIHFYQSRWIRIFQKGIIYESMKDSEFLLKAIGFKDMEVLNEFLSNHILKNLPEHNTNKITVKVKEFDDCYISMNEDNLIALLSLKEAVNQSKNKDKIKDKAIFWSDFTDKLISEINDNKSYYSFNKLLKISTEKINADDFKEVIYA